MSAIGSLSQMTMSASLPGAITPTSPARLTIAALPLVLATIASMGVMPTCLTNSSASLPCHFPWLKADALPVSLPLKIGMPRSRALRIIWNEVSSCARKRSRTRSPKPRPAAPCSTPIQGEVKTGAIGIPALGDDVEVALGRPVAVVDQIDTGLGGGAGRGGAARVDGDLDIVPVGFIDDGSDFVIGNRLNIAPSGI